LILASALTLGTEENMNIKAAEGYRCFKIRKDIQNTSSGIWAKKGELVICERAKLPARAATVGDLKRACFGIVHP